MVENGGTDEIMRDSIKTEGDTVDFIVNEIAKEHGLEENNRMALRCDVNTAYNRYCSILYDSRVYNPSAQTYSVPQIDREEALQFVRRFL